MKKRTLFERLFWTPNYFTVAIRKKEENERPIWERGCIKPDFVMHATRKYWMADPMLAEDSGRTYLFYEAAYRDKGRIEVVEVHDDCTISKPAIALEREYHLSYPYVFRHNETWYMIPESSAINKVQLFKAVKFPNRWEYVTTLIDEHAVDTTIEDVNGSLLMLTFVPQYGSECVVPKAYRVDWKGERDITLQEIQWSDFDPLKVRGAGRIMLFNGRYIRPAQISQATSYGDGLLFLQSNASEAVYRETEIGRLTAEDVCVKGCKADGLHTYDTTDRFEVIDIRCQLPDPLKVLRKLIKH